MSSSITFNYEPGDELRLHKQVANVHKIILEHQRPLDLISRALQAIISDDRIVVEPKIAITPAEERIFHVTGNARSAQQAIDALNCTLKEGLAESPAEIPMIIQPVDCRARLISLGLARTIKCIYNSHPKILSPAEFFALGAKFPDEQRGNPIVTVWLNAIGQFCYAKLHVNGIVRDVNVYRFGPDFSLKGSCRVPVRE